MKTETEDQKKPKAAPKEAALSEAELQEVSGGAGDVIVPVGRGGGPHVKVIDSRD